LCTGQTDRFRAERVDRHRHQGYAHLFAGREEHVHFASVWAVGDLACQVNQDVGILTHRANNHYDLVALLLGADGLACGGEYFLSVGDAGAAEFLHD